MLTTLFSEFRRLYSLVSVKIAIVLLLLWAPFASLLTITNIEINGKRFTSTLTSLLGFLVFILFLSSA